MEIRDYQEIWGTTLSTINRGYFPTPEPTKFKSKSNVNVEPTERTSKPKVKANVQPAERIPKSKVKANIQPTERTSKSKINVRRSSSSEDRYSNYELLKQFKGILEKGKVNLAQG